MEKFLVFLFSCLFVSCSDLNDQKDSVPVVDLPTDPTDISLSEFAVKVDYVLLESDKECMLSDWASFYLTKDYIVAVDKVIYLFDRQTGMFVRTIGQKGQGPDEYLSVINNSFYGNNIVVDKGESWIEYDCKTFISRLIQKPSAYDFMRFSDNEDINKEMSMFIKPILYITQLDSSTYVGYLHNIDGKNPYRLLYFYSDGTVIRKIPNYLTFKDNPDNIYQFKPSFYQYRNTLYFKENFNDTLFSVTNEGLKPYMILDLGDFNIRYEQQDEIEDFSKCILLQILGETEHAIFYTSDNHTGMIDKENIKAKITENGFVDDLQKYPYFLHPKYMQGNEMLCVISAFDVLSSPNSPITLQEDSNPVIAIITIKE